MKNFYTIKLANENKVNKLLKPNHNIANVKIKFKCSEVAVFSNDIAVIVQCICGDLVFKIKTCAGKDETKDELQDRLTPVK